MSEKTSTVRDCRSTDVIDEVIATYQLFSNDSVFSKIVSGIITTGCIMIVVSRSCTPIFADYASRLVIRCQNVTF